MPDFGFLTPLYLLHFGLRVLDVCIFLKGNWFLNPQLKRSLSVFLCSMDILVLWLIPHMHSEPSTCQILSPLCAGPRGAKMSHPPKLKLAS